MATNRRVKIFDRKLNNLPAWKFIEKKGVLPILNIAVEQLKNSNILLLLCRSIYFALTLNLLIFTLVIVFIFAAIKDKRSLYFF